MAGLFGTKKSPEKTILLVDVENGSVGSALAYLSPNNPPKLFGVMRKRTPLFHTHEATKLSEEIERATQAALLHAQEVAARIRMHDAVAPIGELHQGMVFLHGPWSGVSFGEDGEAGVLAVESFLEKMRRLQSSVVDRLPTSFHSFGASTAPLVSRLYNLPEDALVCSLSSEVTELFMVQGNRIVSYGTMPFGTHTLLRTLRTHGGFSVAESYSILQLESPHAVEALEAAAAQFAQEFADTTRELFTQSYTPQVFVLAQEPFAHWAAGALTHEHVGELFADGGTVRAVRAAHVSPFVAAHAPKPDVPLMLGSLFADAQFSTIY